MDKILVGALQHESNTFTNNKTKIEDFDIVKGENILRHEDWMKNNSAGGIIKTLNENKKVSISYSLFGKAIPSGIIKYDAYEKMKGKIIKKLKGNIDGVCLALHGSMFVENMPDPEGNILESIRDIIGSEIPIICALDMHATVSKKMLKMANAFTVYKTAPHTDQYKTGANAAKLMLLNLKNNIELTMKSVKLPMLLSGEKSETDKNPMKDLIIELKKVEKTDKIFSASFTLGFPWADSSHNGINSIVVGDEKNSKEVEAKAKELAKKFWDKRKKFDFTTEAHSFSKALNIAMEKNEKPIIISDSGDNPTAGASENSVFTLKKAMEFNINKSILFAVIYDSEAVKKCVNINKKKISSLELGKMPINHKPLNVKADILSIKKIKRIQEVNDIKFVVLKINNIEVIITNKRIRVTDTILFNKLGLNINDYDILIIKSGYVFPKLSKIASKKLLALTPGDTNQVFSELSYKKIPRPMFPLDDNVNEDNFLFFN